MLNVGLTSKSAMTSGGFFGEPGRRPGERRTRMRVTPADPACRVGGATPSHSRSRTTGTVRLCGLCLNSALHQAFGFAFQLEPRILIGFSTGNCRDALHEVEDAFWLAIFFTQDNFNDLRRL